MGIRIWLWRQRGRSRVPKRTLHVCENPHSRSVSSAFVLSRERLLFTLLALAVVVEWAFEFYLYFALCIRRHAMRVSSFFFFSFFFLALSLSSSFGWSHRRCGVVSYWIPFVRLYAHLVRILLAIIPISEWRHRRHQIRVVHHCGRGESNNLAMIMVMMMMGAGSTTGS